MQSQRRGLIQTLLLVYEKLFGWKVCAILMAGLIAILFACASVPWRTDTGGGGITLIFRYDDFCEVSPLEVEQEILRLFAEFGFPVTFGVTPNDRHSLCPIEQVRIAPEGKLLSQERADAVRWAIEAGIMHVALHGYTHWPHVDGQTGTEFEGLHVDKQRELISKGKKTLQERFKVPIDTFIPPYNSYDYHTVSVLEEMGFTFISAGTGGPFTGGQILYVPTTGAWFGDLYGAIDHARQYSTRALIVLLAHPFDFEETQDPRAKLNLDQLRSILAWVEEQPDVQVRSLADLDDTYNLSAHHMRSLFQQRPFIGPRLGSILGLGAIRRRRLNLEFASPINSFIAAELVATFAFTIFLFLLAVFTAKSIARTRPARLTLPLGIAGAGVSFMVIGMLRFAFATPPSVLPREIGAYMFSVGTGLLVASLLEIIRKKSISQAA